MGFALALLEQDGHATKSNHHGTPDEAENCAGGAGTERSNTVGRDSDPDQDRKDWTGSVDGLIGKLDATQHREHHGEEDNKQSKRHPGTVTGADAHFTEKPAAAANVEKTESEGIHDVESDSGY